MTAITKQTAKPQESMHNLVRTYIYLLSIYTLLIPCWKYGLPYLDKATAATRAVLVVRTHCWCAQPTVCMHRHKNDHVRTRSCSPCQFGGLQKHKKTQ